MKIEQHVENALINLLKTKPISQVFVANLLEEVGICKGTFYKYYCDKYDLLQKCFQHHYYGDIVAQSETFEQFTVNSLAAFRKSPKIVLHAMMSEDANSIFGYHSRLTCEYIVKDRERAGKPVEGEYFEYAMRVYSQNVTQLIVDWLTSHCTRKVEETMALIRGIMPCALTEDKQSETN